MVNDECCIERRDAPFNFVKEQCSCRRLRHGESKQTDFAELATKEQTQTVLRLEFRHIEAKQLVRASEVAGEGNCKLRFPPLPSDRGKGSCPVDERREQAPNRLGAKRCQLPSLFNKLAFFFILYREVNRRGS